MKRIILLDSGPLGVLCSPSRKAGVVEGMVWLSDHLKAGNRIVIPEIADYEALRL
jgi:hypothetical protein